MPSRLKIATLVISATFAWPVLAQPERGAVQLKYLGTAGWEITDGRTVVLIDPYLSRLRRVTPNDTVDPADHRPLFDNAAIALSDTSAIDAHIQRADFVLITHTHYDHALDAPYIASKTGATIIGTESTYHFARAQGVPADKLIGVRGGEDYVFDDLWPPGHDDHSPYPRYGALAVEPQRLGKASVQDLSSACWCTSSARRSSASDAHRSRVVLVQVEGHQAERRPPFSGGKEERLML